MTGTLIFNIDDHKITATKRGSNLTVYCNCGKTVCSQIIRVLAGSRYEKQEEYKILHKWMQETDVGEALDRYLDDQSDKVQSLDNFLKAIAD